MLTLMKQVPPFMQKPPGASMIGWHRLFVNRIDLTLLFTFAFISEAIDFRCYRLLRYQAGRRMDTRDISVEP